MVKRMLEKQLYQQISSGVNNPDRLKKEFNLTSADFDRAIKILEQRGLVAVSRGYPVDQLSNKPEIIDVVPL